MTVHRPFTRLLLAVSALAAAAAFVGSRGVSAGSVALDAIAATLALVALTGIVVLARIVVVTERHRSRR